MTSSLEQRKAQFERALKAVVRSFEQEFGQHEEIVRELSESLRSAGPAGFEAAMECVSALAPKKEFAAVAQSILLEAIKPALEAKRAAVLAVEREHLREELAKIDSFLQAIAAIRAEVEQGVYPARHHRRAWEWRRQRANGPVVPWRGVDVLLSENPVPDYRGDSTVVVTPHAYALCALFKRLRDADPGVLDYVSKYEFYGEMAVKVRARVEESDVAAERPLLLVALSSARRVLSEWRQRLMADRRLDGTFTMI